jgi:hypothetical protein
MGSDAAEGCTVRAVLPERAATAKIAPPRVETGARAACAA